MEGCVARPDAGRPRWRRLVFDHPAGRPALLQAPVPEGVITQWEDDTPTPDALDLLVTSKNHDLKQQRMSAARPVDWLFSLVSLQTAGPYPGRGNFGVIRMNGGSSSRPGLGIAPPGGPGQRWARDVEIAIAERPAIVDLGGYRSNGGIGLLWLQPWDGKSAYSLSALDPFFIEICRRVRVVECDGLIRARRKASAGPRIAKDEAKARKGNTGDLWTPVSHKKESLWVSPSTGSTIGAPQSCCSERAGANPPLRWPYRLMTWKASP